MRLDSLETLRGDDIADDVLRLAREGVDIGVTEPVDLREMSDAAWTSVADGDEAAEQRYAADENREWTSRPTATDCQACSRTSSGMRSNTAAQV